MEKRAVTAVVLGASGRGKLYGDYALEHPEDLKIVGIAELVDLRRTMYGDKYGVPVENRVATWQQMLDRPKFADAVIIATPDHLHYEPCMRALDLGYDILLEKPIAQTFDECRRLVAHARDKKKIVCLTHVLRYSPDILYWMIGKPCRRIAAFGGLKHFKSENAPKGSTERCTDGCAAEATCPFSALKIYYRDRTWLYVFDLPEEEPERGEAILRYLRTTDYGRCVYRCSNDQPDHYVTSMEFAGGVTVNFSIEAFTSYMGRRTRIMGTRGDIVGDMESFTLTDFATGEKTVYDANAIDAENYKGAGHGGGDAGMIRDWIEAVRRQDATIMSTPLDDSLESHAIAFAAERSRKEGRIVELG